MVSDNFGQKYPNLFKDDIAGIHRSSKYLHVMTLKQDMRIKYMSKS